MFYREFVVSFKRKKENREINKIRSEISGEKQKEIKSADATFKYDSGSWVAMEKN